MSEYFENIKAGLEDVLAGRYTRYRIKNVDVKALRARMDMTQEQFAQSFRIPLATLRNWEQEHRAPKGAVHAYLKVIEHNPKAVLEALGQA